MVILVIAVALLASMHYWHRRRLELLKQPFRPGPYC